MLASRHLIWSGKMLLDVLLLAAAFLLACLIRFEGDLPAFLIRGLPFMLPFAVLVQFVCLVFIAPYRSSWRHLSLADALRLTLALMLSCVVLGLWRIFDVSLPLLGPWSEEVIPWGVIVLDLLAACMILVGARVVCRLLGERRKQVRRVDTPRKRTLLIGAGRAGAMAAREIAARPEVGLEPVGFLDDNPSLLGLHVGGVPVIGPTERIAELARRYDVNQVLITIANGTVAEISRINRLCFECGLPVKIIPPLHEIIGSRINLALIHDIALEDLLHRQPVCLDDDDIRAALHGRCVLVTGAGGSIGSELCRKVCSYGADTLVLVERAENSLFQIHRQLLQIAPEVRIVPCLADICDRARMGQLFDDLLPDVVFHAAAHKHVPLMESNPNEAVKNNVLGTVALARLAHERGIGEFVMISTDKAVNPSSIMGASKRVAELFVQSLARNSRTRFLTVRFGNVLGSNGSVVPLFLEQIARGGPVTVTHPEMQRYFMTISEACQLVLQAAVMGKGGEVFILDMGEPVKIVDLAHNLICLSGLIPGKDIAVQYTGLRPGEKLSEELFSQTEDLGKTTHKRIFIGRQKPPDLSVINRLVEDLGELAVAGATERMHAKLREIVTDYQGQETTREATKVLRIAPLQAMPAVAVEVRIANAGTP